MLHIYTVYQRISTPFVRLSRYILLFLGPAGLGSVGVVIPIRRWARSRPEDRGAGRQSFPRTFYGPGAAPQARPAALRGLGGLHTPRQAPFPGPMASSGPPRPSPGALGAHPAASRRWAPIILSQTTEQAHRQPMAKGRATDGKPPRKPGPPTASDPGRVPYHPPSPQRNPGLQYVEERHQNVEHRQTEAERQPTQGQDHLLNRPTGSARAGAA